MSIDLSKWHDRDVADAALLEVWQKATRTDADPEKAMSCLCRLTPEGGDAMGRLMGWWSDKMGGGTQAFNEWRQELVSAPAKNLFRVCASCKHESPDVKLGPCSVCGNWIFYLKWRDAL